MKLSAKPALPSSQYSTSTRPGVMHTTTLAPVPGPMMGHIAKVVPAAQPRQSVVGSKPAASSSAARSLHDGSSPQAPSCSGELNQSPVSKNWSAMLLVSQPSQGVVPEVPGQRLSHSGSAFSKVNSCHSAVP